MPSNDYDVSRRMGDNAIALLSPPGRAEIIPRDKALRLAAWLVALAGGDYRADFEKMLQTVEGER